jgi:opacity protein-like surface antigen
VKSFFFTMALFLVCLATRVSAGTTASAIDSMPNDPLDPPRFEVAVESAYLLCWLNNPHSYEIASEFLTGRVRWGLVQNDSWLRGYQQFYLTAEAQPFVRGIENHYFGMNFGLRYNFVPRNSRWSPYISGGVGLGWIDSNAAVGGTQGQDFTFNILAAAGLSYRIDQHWKINAGVLYEHFSNAGQTSPNPSLNLLGPQLAVGYSF